MRSLFNTESYHALKLEPGDEYRCYQHGGASIAGIVHDGQFTSGLRAPFGGFDFTRPRHPNVHDDVRAVLDQLPERVTIRAKPQSYSGNEVPAQHALLTAGFQVARSELSYRFDLPATFDWYLAGLKAPARRALRHAEDEPWSYDEAADDNEWDIAHTLMWANRAAKGRPLGLDLAYVLALRDAHPGLIRYFLLRHGGVLVAAALLYRVQPGVELVEYWGDCHNLARSPMNVLAARVIERAIAEGVRVVDLGLSSVDGVPDAGLIQFKQSVGARAELRLDFVR